VRDPRYLGEACDAPNRKLPSRGEDSGAGDSVSYYWTYYAATLFMAYAVRNPWACGVALGFFAMRRWLPDPVVLFRSLSRVGSLRRQAELNPANVIVRKQLGLAYLDLLRPRTALRFLDEASARQTRDEASARQTRDEASARQTRDEASARQTRDPEIAYLRGVAMLRIHDDEGALRAFGEALGIDPEKGEPFSAESMRAGASAYGRYGEAYLAAATALERLGRLPQAEEALAMGASCNSSALEPLLRLASVRRRQGDAKGARRAIEEAWQTWGQLPPFMRRKQLGWGVRTLGAWILAR
jgi:tetratricopeptide (TPR) repeat protein